MLDIKTCQIARLSRDVRFDGLFFVAVKTTGIYCRPICPATTPKENNVSYFATAIEAAQAGYRPCLRCRPDSAPGSPAWKGVDTTLERAIRLIHEGALQQGSVQTLSQRLGISDRYLRQLFVKNLGVSPKAFALYQQCLFAKQLLHQSTLPITQIALASGFNSVRRFNDCFQAQLGLTPSQVRHTRKPSSNTLSLKLHYRPPYDWPTLQRFFASRYIAGLEWVDENSYGRTFDWQDTTGKFTARHIAEKNRFNVDIELNNIQKLKPIINTIRRLLDLDVDLRIVEHTLQQHYSDCLSINTGLRLPGTWDVFEAGIRAILGQQISVAAARNHVRKTVETLGQPIDGNYLFPSPQAIAASEFEFLKMPAARKQTLRNLAQHFCDHPNPTDTTQWQSLKGIGPWTINYANMRGLSDPDIFLGGDAGVNNATKKINKPFNPTLAAPWRSYLTLHLWNQT